MYCGSENSRMCEGETVKRYFILLGLFLVLVGTVQQTTAQLNCSGGPLNCYANLVWDITNSRLGIGAGASAPSYRLQVTDTIANNLIARFENTNATNGYGVDIVTAANDATRYTLGVFGAGSRQDLAVFSNGGVVVGTGASPGVGVLVVNSGGSSVTIQQASIRMHGNSVLLDGLPTCTGGGCAMAATSTNTSMNMTTTTTGAVDITVTFSAAFSNAPSCFANNDTTGNLLRVTTVVVGSIHVQGVTVAGDTLRVGCFGN